MVTLPKQQPSCKHPAPLLHHPWFAGEDEGMTLHRYFDDQFIQRFVQDATKGNLTATHQQEWYQKDRFGRTDMPTLRLPMHQTFYVVCCEISCDGLGQPAYDPKRIHSAGFVIRRRTTQGQQQGWMMQEGQALGWQGNLIPQQEPDDYRRFINHQLLQPQYPEPGYSGEETYPLHALMVRSHQPNTANRSRTLLWGYLPLGGSYRSAVTAQTISPAETQALRKELAWPFGELNARQWQAEDSRPVSKGLATPAFYHLLDLLLNRYRIFDRNQTDNHELRQQLAAIHFYPPLVPHAPKPFDPYAAPPEEARGENLLSWIESNRDLLLDWTSAIAIQKNNVTNSRLPSITASSLTDDLYLTRQQADRLRDALLLRGGRAMQTIQNGLSMPRFGQSDDDIFYAVPFVRWQDECGCEKIHWGKQSSLVFRVVSPFDPEVQRPRAIILPGLDDIKRGSAKGVTLIVPKSIADLLLKIKPDMKMESGGPGNSLGLCWNFSFNIPIITLCAFILLMIVINLLNFFFRWLPWAFLAIPRLCGKILSKNNNPT